MKVNRDTLVQVHYTLKVQGGETPEHLKKTFTTRFVYGRDRVLPVLEKAIEGREADEEFEVVIPPEQAFGTYDPSLVNEISLSRFSDPASLRAGEVIQEYEPGGRPVVFTVKEIRDDCVVADFNHPAAGKSLVLQGRIDEVREASFLDILASMNLSRGRGGG